MAVHGKKVRFWLGSVAVPQTPVDLSVHFNEVNFPRSKDEIDTTTFGSEEKTYEPGYRDKAFNTSGIEDENGVIDGHLNALYESDDPVIAHYWPNGRPANATPTPAQPRYSAQVVCLSYDKTSSTGDVNKFSANFRIEGAVTRAVS